MSTRANIIINDNLTYEDKNINNRIGLIAQHNISVGQNSENNLEINAALIAKNGRVGRKHYSGLCNNSSRDTLTLYGSLATNERYGFAYTDGTGYNTRNLVYDNNLTFGPPPNFPVIGEYRFISWQEE